MRTTDHAHRTRRRPGWITYALLIGMIGVLVLTGCGLVGPNARRMNPTATPVPRISREQVTSGPITRGATEVSTDVRPMPLRAKEDKVGIVFTLSEGAEQPLVPIQHPLAEGRLLSDQDIAALLQRLSPLDAEHEDVQPFRFPAASLPAPRPGETVEQPFPPPLEADRPDAPSAGPLAVVRYSPEGDVPLAPYLSVTFDQPMAPLTGHADLAEHQVPLTLTPLPEGRWRWLGTRTLMFAPAGADRHARLPMATEYTVVVPAGTTSKTGGNLAEEVRWQFRTPPPQLTRAHPTGEPQVREPLLFVAFDQRIAPEAVLPTIQVRAGGQTYATRLVSEAEARRDEAVRDLIERAEEGRWLAFRVEEPLPSNTTVTVSIGPGTPSAEGPLTTEEVQSFTFTTYGPLQVVDTRCGWGEECRPLMPWIIRFSNPLDIDAFDQEMVRIEPELPNVEFTISGSDLAIFGVSAGRTTYRVTLDAALPDRFGQTLGQTETVTFRVGSAEPVFHAPWERFIVLDPASDGVFSVYTINYDTIKVQAYAVTPEDWPAYLEYLRAFERDINATPTPPGQRVIDTRIATRGAADALTRTDIDLKPGLRDDVQHLIVIAQPEPGLVGRLRGRTSERVLRIWVQSSPIALDAAIDAEEMLAWANALEDGAALSGVELTLQPGGAMSTTGADGTATLRLAEGRSDGGNRDAAAYLIARRGTDTAILPATTYWAESVWRTRPIEDEYRWFILDDRGIYRPGETVSIKGWVRLARLSRTSDDLALPEGVNAVQMTVIDSRGNQVLSESISVGPSGGFDTTFVVPEVVNLGYTQLRFRLVGGPNASQREVGHAIQVQDFRRPEFEVTTSASAGPHFIGETATASVEAAYYAGGPLPGAEVGWYVTATPTNYRPPNWPDFDFGFWEPWWPIPLRGGWDRQESVTQRFSGVTDAEGVHTLAIDVESADPPRPASVLAEATVFDVNRQAWSSATPLLVHPADRYVGLRSDRFFVQQGQPLDIEAIVTDLDGAAMEGVDVELRAVRLHWAWVRGEWQQEERDEQICSIVSRAEPTTCTFATPQGGTYRITATVRDGQGRANVTQITRWVAGGMRPSAERVEQESVTLIPDRREYQPGDVAEILVQAPFASAEGLLTVRRRGIVASERFTIVNGSHTLRVPIAEEDIPNVLIQVDLVGAAERRDAQGRVDASLPPRPAYASGTLDLSAPPTQRTLTVAAVPRQRELEPGGETMLDITVIDADGRAVGDAEVAVIVVDEAILALTNYVLADPLEAFYPQRRSMVNDHHLRSFVHLVDPGQLIAGETVEKLAMVESAVAMDAAMGTRAMAAMPEAAAAPPDAAGEPIRIRADFNPLALFSPTVITDADGTASVSVTLPDNLTRYRVMAVAVAGTNRFGTDESTLTARLPLMVRPSPPRFLNFGDEFELPIVVQNQTDGDLTVSVALRTSNLTLADGQGDIESHAGQEITVPARNRVEMRFPARTLSAGTVRGQVAIATQGTAHTWADAAQFELPVYTPATSEAFAVYGTVDASGPTAALAQPLLPPSDVYPQFGGLEIQTSSTALQALTDAMIYLVSYPYEGSEQIASRILAVAALRDVLAAFDAEELPSEGELVSAMARDIDTLRGLQNYDGGFPVWQRNKPSWPFHSIHVAHALARARQKGFDIPQETVDRALHYLRQIESHYPSTYSARVRNTLTAYSLYVRQQFGDHDPARGRQLVRETGVEELPFEALGWLLSVLADDPASTQELTQIQRHLANRIAETPGAANFITAYREEEGYLLLASNRRADGILLEGMIRTDPQSDLIPKLVHGLLAHRTRGHWGNTQENVFILLALDSYFQTYEAQTPEFVARAWLGDQYVGEFQFVGRTTDYQTVMVPMAYLAELPGQENLILAKEGPGRLYYRLGLRYAPTNLQLAPLDEGFVVERSYEAVDDPDDVWQDTDGIWHVRAGARVRVRIRLVAPSRRYHVALADPLPAGLEIINPDLAVSGELPADPVASESPFWWWRWTWYEHQNLRDHRAEAFASLLWEGIHTYSYVARATTPGRFVVPPARAEEMYSPEVFGRSGTDWLIVE